MANREVIDLDDSDGEDDIQVISERSREGTGASRSSDVRINNVIPVERYLNNNDNDDDVEIVEERINVPEIPSTPSYVIHSPNGPIPVYENREGSGSAGPERRSFQNARGPIPTQSYRNPQEVAGRAEQMRREEQIRAQNINKPDKEDLLHRQCNVQDVHHLLKDVQFEAILHFRHQDR
ncbi:unnamed protein product [Wickerhamomyces anomalus]